jgi:serine/threonine-protein kinase
LPDLTGRVLGDYQLLRRLGTGGMGQVYLARQLSLKRDVAVKLLRNDLSTNATALKRFQAEAEAVAKLNHPNIVHIHQIGEHDGFRYMVLEYVNGRNLRDYLDRKGPPDLAINLSVIKQVVLALQKAHEQGIVHRDIKPENILVTRKVEVKVADFGLSRYFAGEGPSTHLTQSGITLGTPLYMAPEQVQGQETDHRTDIYSLGVTCYHLLTGEPPFRGISAFDVALKHVQEQPRPIHELRPDLPDALCAMVHKMMAKNPEERYQSAREILRDLSKIKDSIAVSSGQTPGNVSQQQQLALSVSIPAMQAPAGSVTAPPEPVTQPQTGLWFRWTLAGVACLAAGIAGILLADRHQPPLPDASNTATIIGLPDVRSVEKLITTRERELFALLKSQPSPEKALRGTIELGLLNITEHRLDEAKDRFERLERDALPNTSPKKVEADNFAIRHASMAGRLGQAVVLAQRDTPVAAQQSNDLVMRVVTNPFPQAGKADKFEKGYFGVVDLLLRYPELAQALAESLNRNAVVLGKARLDPPPLEQLRNPPKTAKKE